MSEVKKQTAEELAEEYTNTDYFRLEYSTFGTTAKECQKAFLAGYKACEERDRELIEECERVLGFCNAKLNHAGIRCTQAENTIMKLQKIRMRDDSSAVRP